MELKDIWTGVEAWKLGIVCVYMCIMLYIYINIIVA